MMIGHWNNSYKMKVANHWRVRKVNGVLWWQNECLKVERIFAYGLWWKVHENFMKISWLFTKNNHEIFHETFMKYSWGFTGESSGECHEIHERLMKKCLRKKKWKINDFCGNYMFHEKVMTIMKISWGFTGKSSGDFHEYSHDWFMIFIMRRSWDFFEEKIMRGSFAHEDFIRFIRSWVSWTFHESHECLMNESLMNNSWNIHDSFMKYSYVHETLMTIRNQS